MPSWWPRRVSSPTGPSRPDRSQASDVLAVAHGHEALAAGVAADPRPPSLRPQNYLGRESELDHVVRVDPRDAELAGGGGIRHAGAGDRRLAVHPVAMAL